jgi:hypothetical protein
MDVFTGAGAEQIGAFLREYGKIPGVKRVVQVETQQAAQKLAGSSPDSKTWASARPSTKILADARTPARL